MHQDLIFISQGTEKNDAPNDPLVVQNLDPGGSLDHDSHLVKQAASAIKTSKESVSGILEITKNLSSKYLKRD